MNLIKQYIVQCISNATNSLRLSTQKIEVVALLRELISNSENLESDIKKMKTVTLFSTLAIRLNEIYNFLTQGQVEMSRLSEKFKEHSKNLIKDLNHMLDMVNPSTFKEAIDNLYKNNQRESDSEINIDLSKRKAENISFDDEQENLQGNIIAEEGKGEDIFFQNYESNILKPIKPLDTILKNIAEGEANEKDIISFANTLQHNAEISNQAGFEIIANMHKIVAKALRLINCGELKPEKQVIESMRACLIVIVAVVRGKEVNITNYLNMAEEFGGSIETLKIKEDI